MFGNLLTLNLTMLSMSAQRQLAMIDTRYRRNFEYHKLFNVIGIVSAANPFSAFLVWDEVSQSRWCMSILNALFCLFKNFIHKKSFIFLNRKKNMKKDRDKNMKRIDSWQMNYFRSSNMKSIAHARQNEEGTKKKCRLKHSRHSFQFIGGYCV